MTSFAERLAAAKAAKQEQREYRDVEVILDAGLGRKIDALRDDLMVTQQEETEDGRLGVATPRSDALQGKIDDLLGEAADELVTLRFYELPAPEWADICSRSPVRLGVPMDEHYGYNADQVAVLAAPLCGVRLEDGAEVALVSEPATDDAPAVDEWRDVFATISGHEFRLIADAIFELNEYLPAQRLAAAKKASATRRG